MPLVISMMALTLLTALAGALVLGTVTETAIAASYREGTETFYAAEAVMEVVIQDLAAAPDWEEIINGETVSSFADGPIGVRRVGAVMLDLTAATQDVVAATSGYDDDASYRLYAHGRLADLVPGSGTGSPYYLVAWIAGLAGEGSEGQSNVRIVGRAYGPTGSRRSVVVSVVRPDSETTLRVVSWHELR
jgi:hypothetical protein